VTSAPPSPSAARPAAPGLHASVCDKEVPGMVPGQFTFTGANAGIWVFATAHPDHTSPPPVQRSRTQPRVHQHTSQQHAPRVWRCRSPSTVSLDSTSVKFRAAADPGSTGGRIHSASRSGRITMTVRGPARGGTSANPPAPTSPQSSSAARPQPLNAPIDPCVDCARRAQKWRHPQGPAVRAAGRHTVVPSRAHPAGG
jgi:hypothetical protein